MNIYGEYEFDPAEREAFSAGALSREWAARYPMLFDEHDLRMAVNQPGYHYFEWKAAIQFYEDTGWFSLVEKYQAKNHARKWGWFEQIVPREIFELLTSGYFGGQQGPDLLVYATDRSDWYFCEVKGLSDRLSARQKVLFATLERMSGKEIRVVRYRARKAIHLDVDSTK